ncbi:MAG: hypothetical protein ABW215_11660 [Kibdelosporangium sp.]
MFQSSVVWRLTHETERDRREADERLGRLAAGWRRWLPRTRRGKKVSS